MRIERAVLINAPIQRVWQLTAEPGWWVSRATPKTAAQEGDVVVARHDKAGAFPVRVVTVDRPFYISYRWNCADTNVTPHAQNSTLVEFVLQAESEKVRCTVSETGFELISPREDIQTRYLMSNTAGWQAQLADLCARAEQIARSTRAPRSPEVNEAHGGQYLVSNVQDWDVDADDPIKQGR